ncbi:MAG: YkgJ family cysteine cluster protein [Bryobacterales bacterium]|nr:YkgJ family cysteine cluster protein [Bryobacterales bacterium]
MARSAKPAPATAPPAVIPPARELRFACQPGCTNCCNVAGYVYLTEENLIEAARYLRLSAAEFERRFVYRTRHLLRLRKPRGSQCHFLKEDGCAIHPAKPTQCRLFPFWPELVKSAYAWKTAGRRCPGIGQGPLVQIGEALEQASEMEHAYPTIYSQG